jgi:predicted MFS family arabinose efflux permease
MIDIQSRIKRITAVYLIAFLAAILLISLYINMSSFRNQFVTNELSFYSVSGSRVVDNIEHGLLYGKSLDKFYGMDRLVREWSEKNREVTDVKILSADKREIWYRLTGETGNRNAGTAGGAGADGVAESAGVSAGSYIDDSISLEIRDSGGTLRGWLNIAVDLKERMELLARIRNAFLAGAAILILAGIPAIIAFCRKSGAVTDGRSLDKKKILRFMLITVFLMQTVFTAWSAVTLRGFYIEISNNTEQEIRTLVQADIDKVIGMGVAYDQIYDFESYAKDVTEKAPMIESIELSGGQLKVTASEKYIEKAVNKMLLDMVTVLVTAMFIAAEIVNYMLISINRRVEKAVGHAAYDKRLRIRASSFLIHVACYLPVSFIPALMYRFTGENASDFILGLPVMTLFAAGVLFTILAGNWSLRYGWRKLLFIGVALVIASSLLAGMFANAAVLVIARGIFGAAYATVYIAIREFAAAGADRGQRAASLAQVTAGLYAGVNIGAVLGAIIYESAGFRGVFAISAAIGLLAIVAVKNYCVIPEGYGQNAEPDAADAVRAPAEGGGTGFLSVIKDREMIRLALFIIAPLAVTGLFFDYFLPVYSVKEAIGSADIGRAFLVNGLAIAYAAPLAVKYISGRLSEKAGVFLFTLLMAAGFVIFGLTGGLAGILIAAAVMGIAEGTALVSQNMIMLDLEVAGKAGTSRMLSVYATVRKIAQAAGPQIFAVFMAAGYESGMVVFGGAVAACSALYILSGRTGTAAGRRA